MPIVKKKTYDYGQPFALDVDSLATKFCDLFVSQSDELPLSSPYGKIGIKILCVFTARDKLLKYVILLTHFIIPTFFLSASFIKISPFPLNL